MKFSECRREIQDAFQALLCNTEHVRERMPKNRKNRGGFIFSCWQLITFSLIQRSCFPWPLLWEPDMIK